MMNIQTVHDVTFIGIQEQPSGLPGVPMYTDHVTGSTFVIEPGETLVQAVERKREQFKQFERRLNVKE
jgi:hypothetical protein